MTHNKPNVTAASVKQQILQTMGETCSLARHPCAVFYFRLLSIVPIFQKTNKTAKKDGEKDCKQL